MNRKDLKNPVKTLRSGSVLKIAMVKNGGWFAIL
jgi:hypothetical protein